MLQQAFCDLILLDGFTEEEAFKKSFPDLCVGKTEEEIHDLALKELKKKDNFKYYKARVEEVSLDESDKIKWNLEISNKRKLRLLEYLENKVYNDENEKMAVLTNIVNLNKQLDLINGLEEKKISVNINPIQTVAISKMKTYDENGNIVDADYKEVEIKEIEKNGK